MSKDPAFLFYSSDFLTGCLDLDMEERGQYITLLCLQHQKGHISEKTIRLCVGSVSDSVLSKFSQDKDGLFFNHRLEEEIEKRKSFNESRRKNGALGGRPSQDKKPSGKPSGKPSENLPENENININNSLNNNNILNNLNYETLFFDFWQSYIPVKCDGRFVDKGSKKLSFEKFIKLLNSGVEYEDIISGLHAYLNHCRENKQFTCTVPVFLNQRRWEDDYNGSTVVAEEPKRERSEPKSILETYAEIAAGYEQKDNFY